MVEEKNQVSKAEKKRIKARTNMVLGSARGSGTTYSCLHSTVKDRAGGYALFAKRKAERRARKKQMLEDK